MNIAAAGKSWAELTNRLPTFWELLGMIVVTGILIWVTFRLRAWFRDDDDPAAAERQLLAGLHEMTEEGELSEDEYRLLKRRLGATVAKAHLSKATSKAESSGKTLEDGPLRQLQQDSGLLVLRVSEKTPEQSPLHETKLPEPPSNESST